MTRPPPPWAVEAPYPAPVWYLPALPRRSLYALDANGERLANRACVEEFLRLHQRWVEAEVFKHAHQLARALRRLDERITLGDGDRHRLLYGDVLARLQRGDAHFRVQMVGRDHLHSVHVGVGKQLSVIGVGLPDLPVGRSPPEQRLVHIADGVKLRFGVVLVAQVM